MGHVSQVEKSIDRRPLNRGSSRLSSRVTPLVLEGTMFAYFLLSQIRHLFELSRSRRGADRQQH